MKKETMLNCHDLMMEKKLILEKKAKELNFTGDEFKAFWNVYYPMRIDEDISIKTAHARYYQYGMDDITSFRSDSCPYCCANDDNCFSCAYGKVQGMCKLRDSKYNKARVFWKEMEEDKYIKNLERWNNECKNKT